MPVVASTPAFTLAYTSARPALLPAVIDRWLGAAAQPGRVETVVCVDEPDAGRAEAALAGGTPRTAVRLVINRGPRTCVAGWNEAARHATGDILIAISDDFHPPARWDEALLAAGPDGWWREDRVVAVADGNLQDVFTLPVLTRHRLERFGYLFHPDYESLFSDTELTAVANADGVVLDARNLLFEHSHHDIGKRPKDAVDARHSSRERWQRGEALFLSRQRAGFPRISPPVAAGRPEPGELRFAVYIQATKDDFCLRETVEALLAQARPGDAVVSAVYFCVPDEYWSGRPTPADEIAQVHAVADRLRQLPAAPAVQVWLQRVAPHRVSARTRIEVETRVRNAALREIRRGGFEHILVVDGDEWWRPGSLAALVRCVREHRPPAVISRLVPVIGLPGYPVEGATQWATIYVGPQAVFAWCRGICGVRQSLKGEHILHFTATRRTLAGIATKHRESGHYDDPDYDFEGWIRDVLPRIRPGMKGAHMYRPEQIWPCVRRWREDELAALPASLRPFLGRETESRWARFWRRLAFWR